MTDDRISRDEAREIVGGALYGQAWIAEFPGDQYQLQYDRGPQRQSDRPHLSFVPPWPESLSDRLAMAVGRYALVRAQGQTVDEWLLLYGFDCLEEDFDRDAFSAALDGPLGKSISDARDSHLGPVASESSPTPPRRRGGAPQRFNREEIKAVVVRLMDRHGDFAPSKPGWNAQARLEYKVLEAFGDREPAISTLRPILRPILDEWRAQRSAPIAVFDHSDHLEK
jgi:hypothetical protein